MGQSTMEAESLVSVLPLPQLSPFHDPRQTDLYTGHLPAVEV